MPSASAGRKDVAGHLEQPVVDEDRHRSPAATGPAPSASEGRHERTDARSGPADRARRSRPRPAGRPAGPPPRRCRSPASTSLISSWVSGRGVGIRRMAWESTTRVLQPIEKESCRRGDSVSRSTTVGCWFGQVHGDRADQRRPVVRRARWPSRLPDRCGGSATAADPASAARHPVDPPGSGASGLRPGPACRGRHSPQRSACAR